MGQENKELRILVTGGQGFLGGALVRALLDQGYKQVATTVRRPAPELESLPLEVVKADLCDRERCFETVQNRDLIFHTAAKAGVWGAMEDYQGINVEATRNLLAAASAHGVKHFVHTSSPSVTFQGESELLKDEKAPYGRKPLNAYCATKIQAERLVLEASEPEGLRTLALRPHLIYGPGDPHLLPRVFRVAKAGRLMRVGDGDNLVDVTHIDDCVQAHLCALERLEEPSVWGEAYFITSGQPVRLWSWLAHLLHWKGIRPIKRSIGLRAAVALGKGLESLFRVLGKKEEPPLTHFSALQLGCSHTYDISKARERLCYEPKTDPWSDFDVQLGV